MISIYTRSNNLLTKEFWKWALRRALKKHTGPDAVLKSLIRGLEAHEINFELNPIVPKYAFIHVLSGTTVLSERIRKKLNNQTLIAGPTITTSPLDHDFLLCNKKIDNKKKEFFAMKILKKQHIIDAKQLEHTKADFGSKIFSSFNEYTLATTGNTLTNVNQAIQFALFHEGLHAGYILALLRALKV